MATVYDKDGNGITCNRDQIEDLCNAGYSIEKEKPKDNKPEGVKKPVIDLTK